jgi:tRNA U34 5-carboxymethylaminomethyl modifying GTPase MnmE/TrmE
LVKQIQAGCDLYREAKTQFVEIKKTADEVVVIGKEITGFWNKLVKFFTAAKPTAPKPVAKKKEKFVAVDEEQILNDVVDQLIQFFHLQEQLQAHIRESEERSRNIYDPDANLMEEALKRVRAQDQMQKLVEDIRMAMTWNAPKELGALYSKVFEMREIVGAEQEAARLSLAAKTERKRWQRQQREASNRLKVGVSVLTLMLILYLWLWFLWLMQMRKI